jgi:hypothetical protein
MATLLRRLLSTIAVIVTILAALDQLGRRPVDRDWHGRIVGVPYDFRMPTRERVLNRLWSATDERVIVPQLFGIGWTINLYQLRRRLQLLVA